MVVWWVVGCSWLLRCFLLLPLHICNNTQYVYFGWTDRQAKDFGSEDPAPRRERIPPPLDAFCSVFLRLILPISTGSLV